MGTWLLGAGHGAWAIALSIGNQGGRGGGWWCAGASDWSSASVTTVMRRARRMK